MKKFIIKIALFFLIIPFAYIILVIISGEVLPQFLKKNLSYKVIGGYMQTRLNEISSYGKCDILVVGPSAAYRGLDPRIFQQHNIKIFNLGSSSQTPVQTELLLNNHISKIKPELVIYVLSPEIFCEDGIESMVDLISNHQFNNKNITVPLSTCNINVYNTIIYSSYKSIISKEEDSDIKTDDDTYISGGFVEKKNKKAEIKKYPQSTSSDFLENQMNSFRNSILLLAKQNIPVLFIQPPLQKDYYLSNKNKERTNRFFEKLHCNYLNFNNDNTFSDDLFYDHSHLNQDGVEVFNKILIDSLKRIGVNSELPTSRKMGHIRFCHKICILRHAQYEANFPPKSF